MQYLYVIICPNFLFLLTIVLSVLLRFTASDYPFESFRVVILSSYQLGDDVVNGVVNWFMHLLYLVIAASIL
jgi:hypothetical protein